MVTTRSVRPSGRCQMCSFGFDRAIGLVQLRPSIGGSPAPRAACARRATGRAPRSRSASGRGSRRRGPTASGRRRCRRSAAVGVEDGDAGRELIEHAAVGVDQARSSSPRMASASVASMPMPALPVPRRHIEHVEAAPGAGDDRRQRGRRRLLPAARARLASSRAARSSSSSRARPHRAAPWPRPRAHRRN